VASYNKDAAWEARPDRLERARTEAFEKVSAHISALLAKGGDNRGNVILLHAASEAQAAT
jgi:hypothetical protein